MNILIYRLGSLGDTVAALPALRLIAKHFGDASRVMLTEFAVSAKAPTVAAVLDGTGLVDSYIEYPLNLRDPRAVWALRRSIRQARPKILVYLGPPRGRSRAIRDAVFFHFCGIHRQIGVPYTQARQTRQKLPGEAYEYEGARLLRCIEELGAQKLDAPDAFELCLTPAEHQLAAAALAPLGDAPFLAASIGAKADTKDWGQENWCALMAQLGEKLPGWGLGLLGAPVERARSAELAAIWPGPSVNLCGEASVRVSAAVLARAKLYLGHDSGPMHLAAAVGTRCVAIFSSQNLPGEWFPYGTGHKVIYRDIECKGCRLVVCEARQKACIRSITVDEVLQAVLEVGRG